MSIGEPFPEPRLPEPRLPLVPDVEALAPVDSLARANPLFGDDPPELSEVGVPELNRFEPVSLAEVEEESEPDSRVARRAAS